MARPTIIFFGPDGPDSDLKKVFIRTLIYSTSEKGQYIQNMWIRLTRGESTQNFNIWVYDNDGLVRGSGLFIGKSGIASNHHFLMPNDKTKYEFLQGDYLMEIFVELVGKKPKKIFEQILILTEAQEAKIKDENVGVYFDWAPNTQSYYASTDKESRKSDFQRLAQEFIKEYNKK